MCWLWLVAMQMVNGGAKPVSDLMRNAAQLGSRYCFVNGLERIYR
jgi:hypothetical protein